MNVDVNVNLMKLIIRKVLIQFEIFGFYLNGENKSIGFCLRKNEKQDRYEWLLYLYCLGFNKCFNLKTVLDDYYIVCECGGLVWKHNSYCNSCGEDFHDENNCKFVYRKPERYKDEIEELTKLKCKIEVEIKNKD